MNENITTVDEIFQRFGNSWETIAPEVIEMCTRRCAIHATLALIATIVCAVVCAVSWTKAKDDCDWYYPLAIFGIMGILVAFGLTEAAIDLGEWIISPNTKAIEYVLMMVRGR